MAAHSSVLAWRTPQTEGPGGLRSMGSQRVGLKRLNTHTHTYTHTHRALFSKLFGHGSHYFFFIFYITSFKLY